MRTRFRPSLMIGILGMAALALSGCSGSAADGTQDAGDIGPSDADLPEEAGVLPDAADLPVVSDEADVPPDAAAATGETCATAWVIPSVPFRGTGSTSGASNEYAAALAGCPGAPGPLNLGGDRVFRLTPPVTGTYTMAVQGSTSAQVGLFVIEECAAPVPRCKGILGSGMETWLDVNLEADRTVYVVVFDQGGETNPGQPFVLDITACVPFCDGKTCGGDGCGGSCGMCDPGKACVAGGCEPLPATCNPVADLGCGRGVRGAAIPGPGATLAFSTHGGCPESNPGLPFAERPELVYRFQPSLSGKARVHVPDGGSWVLTVREDTGTGCADAAGTCLHQAVAGFTDTSFDVVAGRTYYLVWEPGKGDGKGLLGFDLDCCAPTCEPGTCG